MTFDLEEKAETEDMDLSIWSARLARLKLEVKPDGWNFGYLILYEQTNSSLEYLETKQVEADVEGMDVTVPVSQHLETENGRITFYLRCNGCQVSNSILEILFVPKEGEKWGRENETESTDRPTDRQHSKCSRNKMTVSIKDIPEMNFILHPLEFEAYRCGGDCPAEYSPADGHAILQSFIRQQDEMTEKYPFTPAPRCAPKSLKDLDVIYLDECNTIKRGTWKQVIVEECACS